MQISKQIARYVTSLSYEKIPNHVVEFTKLCILDYFSSAIAGREKRPILLLGELVAEMGGNRQATLMNGEKSTVMNATFWNGAAGHIVELDDIHKGSIVHAATVVIPPALAIAEWKQLSGKALIEAIVAGYEVSFRIGEAVSPSHYYYFHNTATCGTFGASIAAAKLLQLSEEEIVMALGSAGTQAAGLWEFIEDGAMSKQLHTAKAAMNGVMSALLAQKGFTGATKILEGNRGFVLAMSDDADITKLTNGLENSYKIIENSFKIHASCRHTHAAMDLALQLYQTNLNLDEIETIRIKTYEVAINITNNPRPKTVYEAKFSMQFCVALAIIYGEGGLHAFTEERVANDKLIQIMNKIRLEIDDEINGKYPEEWGTALELQFTDGTIQRSETNFPKGDPENPVTESDLTEKFYALTNSLDKETQAKLVHLILDLEKITNIEEVMSAIQD